MVTIERGKHIRAPVAWVEFVLMHTDIMAALTDAPMRLVRADETHFEGEVFGATLSIEHLAHTSEGGRGSIRELAEVTLPCRLGGTYVTAWQEFASIDDETTSLEMRIDMRLKGLVRVYAFFRRGLIQRYIERVCSDIEEAARALVANRSEQMSVLSGEQRERVSAFRTEQEFSRSRSRVAVSAVEASIALSVVGETMLVEAEALLPDSRFLNAKERIASHGPLAETFREEAGVLRRIGIPGLALRGEGGEAVTGIEFRQAAFEFGYRLYREYFREDIRSVLPVIVGYGETAFLKFDIDPCLESLPWEALHDGSEFLALTVRFARSLGGIREASQGARISQERIGILLVGSDARGDLPGARNEVVMIADALGSLRGVRVEQLSGARVSRRTIIAALESGQYNILHYSGHSVFDGKHPAESYLDLPGGERLFLHEFAYLGGKGAGRRLPLDLVFLNSCESGRLGVDPTLGRGMSMCRALRLAGVDDVVGMLWNVADDGAAEFGTEFYRLLAQAERIDIPEIMRQARRRVAMDRSWADGSWLAPVLYV